jgi:hypothetical protein
LLGSLGTVPLNANTSLVSTNASISWRGQVIVTSDAAKCGVAAQLPGVTASPKVGPVQGPTLGVPGQSLPTVSVPAGLPSVPGQQTTSASAPQPADHSSTPPLNYTPPGQSVQDKVVPQGNFGGGLGRGANGNGTRLDGGAGTGVTPNPDSMSTNAAAPGSGANRPTSSGDPLNLTAASNRAPGGQMPVLLAILAIVALSLVTATYARLYLLRRSSS